MDTSTVEHEHVVKVSNNQVVVRVQVVVPTKEDGDAGPPVPPPTFLLPPPHPPAVSDVTAATFRVGRSYHLMSADGKRVLSASKRKSDRGSQHGGFRLDFLEDRLWKSRGTPTLFTFSGHHGAYRMHSGLHHNNMLYFLGANHQLDWVVWDCAVPTNGEWEVMKLHWLEGDVGRTKVKIEFFEGFFVKWVVSGFTGVKEWDAATEFVLREI